MKNGKTEPTLDERIVALLKNPDGQPSSVFADILAEIDTAIDAADQEGRVMRARSIDPAILDPAARGAAEDSECSGRKT
jgi:hypothetical protein